MKMKYIVQQDSKKNGHFIWNGSTFVQEKDQIKHELFMLQLGKNARLCKGMKEHLRANVHP